MSEPRIGMNDYPGMKDYYPVPHDKHPLDEPMRWLRHWLDRSGEDHATVGIFADITDETLVLTFKRKQKSKSRNRKS